MGKSEGLLGYIESFEQHMSDAEAFVENVNKLYRSNIPKFITGLSFGGLTAYMLALKYPQLFNGSIFYAPALSVIYSKFE